MKKNLFKFTHMCVHELIYIKKVLDSDYIAPLGKYVNKF